MGHTKDIAASIKRGKVNVSWGIAINTSLGYSSIEIGAMGVPGFYWNFDEETEAATILEQTNGAMMVHNRTDDFVADNLKYITNKDSLAELSARQREFIFNRHHIPDRIKIFEEYVVAMKSAAV
jgi:hypothetical protein